MLRILLRVSGVAEVALGLVLLIGTRSTLEMVTSEKWEIDLLRYVGLFMVSLGLLLGWDRRKGGRVPRPVWRRVAGVWTLLVIYLFTTTGFFLFLGFSLLMAVTLEVGMVMAWAYSEALRRQLDSPGQPPQ